MSRTVNIKREEYFLKKCISYLHLAVSHGIRVYQSTLGNLSGKSELNIEIDGCGM